MQLFLNSKIEDSDLNILQYLLCGIVSYWRVIFWKHWYLRLYLLKTWTSVCLFAVLKAGAVIVQYSVYVQYAVCCKCVQKRLGLIHKLHFLLHLSRMFISLLHRFIVKWSESDHFCHSVEKLEETKKIYILLMFRYACIVHTEMFENKHLIELNSGGKPRLWVEWVL